MEGIITNDIVYNTVNNSGGTEQYEFIISLGSFCSPAIELERYGFRDSSYPFDWLLTHTFETVLDLIDNDFLGFLDGNRLYQRSRERQVYENTDLDISFVHDFSSTSHYQINWKWFKKNTDGEKKGFITVLVSQHCFSDISKVKSNLHMLRTIAMKLFGDLSLIIQIIK